MLGLVAETEPVDGLTAVPVVGLTVVGFVVTDGLLAELEEPDDTRPAAPEVVRPAVTVDGREAEEEPED